VYFAMGNFEAALRDFERSHELDSEFKWAIAGLAITHHALGHVEKARKLWRRLLAQDERYRDADWVKQKLNWPDPLVEEARKLIAGLDA
jgi:tetratricopeptide (TPR) repeat protein